MLHKIALTSSFIFFFLCIFSARGQHAIAYNLVKLLQENKLEPTLDHQQTLILDSSKKQAISTNGIVWLKDVSFNEGTIDVDLRGKDVFLQSFMGIVFHAKDTTTYDVVYFCPFRFHDTDAIARKYSVKYMSLPDYSYLKLRKAYPGVYENSVAPAPQANEWFHVTIVIKGDWVTVYVDHSTTASLKVKRPDSLNFRKIGLWSWDQGLSSDFANLTITE
jgi:hypothetical protein